MKRKRFEKEVTKKGVMKMGGIVLRQRLFIRGTTRTTRVMLTWPRDIPDTSHRI